jgi:hypothetical protein
VAASKGDVVTRCHSEGLARGISSFRRVPTCIDGIPCRGSD